MLYCPVSFFVFFGIWKPVRPGGPNLNLYLTYIPPLLLASKYVFQTKFEHASAIMPCLVTTDTRMQISSQEAASHSSIQEAIRLYQTVMFITVFT
jgi:hypothetical protein